MFQLKLPLMGKLLLLFTKILVLLRWCDWSCISLAILDFSG